MKTLNAELLKNKEIYWLHDKKTAPMAQGMALNKLNEIYRGATRFGYVLLNDEEIAGIEEGCYYLLELKTRIEKEVLKCLVAFKENGDSVQGYAIFKNSLAV